jgi:HlyD family secretion protein
VTSPRQRKRLLWSAIAVAAVALLAFALYPSAVTVETGRVERGPLQVTIEEEGETRARDRFVLAAPVPGRLLRVAANEGDTVKRGEVIARIEPLPLSQRERQEALARVSAAEAALQRAIAQEAHAREDSQLAQNERQRAEQLARDGVISSQLLDQARNADVTAREELAAARYSVEVASSEVKIARAGLVGLDNGSGQSRPLVELRSPVNGSVLRVLEESERVIQAGTPVLVLGEPDKLEIVTDVLSTDAVKMSPGDPVLVAGWGGDKPLRARVRRVEPAGFTKVSALGVEEQRVNVISDFVDPPGPLGDAYRVETQIIIWSADNVLQAPLSAVFRQQQGWGAFVIENGRAKRRNVQIGHRTDTMVEIVDGLSEGESVIVHPASAVAEGVRVQAR